MPEAPVKKSVHGRRALGSVTQAEILQQPSLWPNTLEIVRAHVTAGGPLPGSAVLAGAGSSAYAASAIAASWPGARAISSTDLLLDLPRVAAEIGGLVSVARSGDSPESLALVRKYRSLRPEAPQLALTCNGEGALARAEGVTPIRLDPRTNDRGLAMTSSYSNLILAGLCLNHVETLSAALPAICRRTEQNFPAYEKEARDLATRGFKRITVLGSGPLFASAQEAALKILEMTGGQCVAIAETYLGLRHGPMSFVQPDSAVLCFLSSDPKLRRYEQDLLAELRKKQLGEIIGIGAENEPHGQVDRWIPANAPDLPDHLRAPFEIVFPQLLAFHLSLSAGLDPDNPSPAGVITRVVAGVRIYED